MKRLFWGIFVIMALGSGLHRLEAFHRGNELTLVPIARMEPAGYLEVGGGVSGGYNSKSVLVSEGDIFLRYAFSERFEYGVTDLNDRIYHHLQLGFEPLGSPTQSAHLSIGIKNIGWQNLPSGNLVPASTVMGAFIVTSFQLREHGAWIHAGFAENKIKSRVTGFVGLEYDIPLGRFSGEWDNELFSFGYRVSLADYFQLSIAVQTRFKALTEHNLNPETLKIGFSLIDPPQSVRRKWYVSQKFTSFNIPVSPNSTSTLNARRGTANLGVTPNNLVTSNRLVTSNVVPTSTVKSSTPNADVLKASIAFMKLGDQYYYQGMFKEALANYLEFVKLNPTLPEGYVAIGSIYKQLGREKEALKYWRRALELDPNNAQLRAYEAIHGVEIQPKSPDPI